jgi:hypothetical protein
MDWTKPGDRSDFFPPANPTPLILAPLISKHSVCLGNFLERYFLQKGDWWTLRAPMHIILKSSKVVSSICTALADSSAQYVLIGAAGEGSAAAFKWHVYPLGINVFQSLFDLNIKMHFTERLLIGLVTAYPNQQIKETAWFQGNEIQIAQLCLHWPQT